MGDKGIGKTQGVVEKANLKEEGIESPTEAYYLRIHLQNIIG